MVGKGGGLGWEKGEGLWVRKGEGFGWEKGDGYE